MLKLDKDLRGKNCTMSCPYYHALNFKEGWCEFSFIYTSMLEKEFNQPCDLEDYIKFPVFYQAKR